MRDKFTMTVAGLLGLMILGGLLESCSAFGGQNFGPRLDGSLDGGFDKKSNNWGFHQTAFTHPPGKPDKVVITYRWADGHVRVVTNSVVNNTIVYPEGLNNPPPR